MVGRTFCSEGRFVEGRFVLVPDRQAGGQAVRRTGRQTGGQADRQATGRWTGRRTGRRTTVRQADKWTDKPTKILCQHFFKIQSAIDSGNFSIFS